MTKEQALNLILKNYPEKDMEWATYQLERSMNNADGASFEDVLEGEFGINVGGQNV